MLNNQLKKQAQVRESVLAIIVMLAICYMSFSIFYSPNEKKSTEFTVKLKEVKEKKTGIQKLNSALKTKYEQQAKELKQAAKMEASLDPKVRMIRDYEDSIFKNISEFLNYVTGIDFKSGVEITSMKYDIPAKRKGYAATKFFFNISGRFSTVTEFINRLEGVPALVSLDRISIRVNPKDSNLVNMDLEGTFYELEKDNG